MKKKLVKFVQKDKKSTIISGLSNIINYLAENKIPEVHYHRMNLKSNLKDFEKYGCTEDSIMELFKDNHISNYYGCVDAMITSYNPKGETEKQFVMRFSEF